MLKKSISVLLTLVMIVSVFTIVPTSAFAEDVESNLENQQINDSTSKEFEANVEFVETDETKVQNDETAESEPGEAVTYDDADIALVGANEQTIDGFTISIINNNATITAYSDSSVSELVVPSTLNGYTVTAIGANAFYGYTSLQGIELPDSITEIGEYAFYGDTSLQGLVLPQNLERVYCRRT